MMCLSMEIMPNSVCLNPDLLCQLQYLRLTTFPTFFFFFFLICWVFVGACSSLACMHALEKEMATHSSILAQRIPGMEEPGGLLSMGSHRVRQD